MTNLLSKLWPAGPLVKELSNPLVRRFELREEHFVTCTTKAVFAIEARLLAYHRRSWLFENLCPDDADAAAFSHAKYTFEKQIKQTDYPEIEHDLVLSWGIAGASLFYHFIDVRVASPAFYGERRAVTERPNNIFGSFMRRRVAFTHLTHPKGLKVPDFSECVGKVLRLEGQIIDVDAPGRAPWYSDTVFGDDYRPDGGSMCETLYVHRIEVL